MARSSRSYDLRRRRIGSVDAAHCGAAACSVLRTRRAASRMAQFCRSTVRRATFSRPLACCATPPRNRRKEFGMKVLVLGSGVIGVTCAYELAHPGHEVTVVDRQPAPALETSYAQRRRSLARLFGALGRAGRAGQGDQVAADAAPPAGDPAAPGPGAWCAGAWRCCAIAPRHATRSTRRRMVRLAEYSRDCLRALRAQTGIAYDERMQGTLQLFRTQKQLDGTGRRRRDPAALAASPSSCSTATAASATSRRWRACATSSSAACDCRATRPATASSSRSAWPRLRRAARRRVPPATRHPRACCSPAIGIVGVATERRNVAADAYLVALGSYSPLLLRPLGIRIPVYPVKGYSITVPIADAAGAPESTVMDETHKVAVTRLGDRIRVGGTAELAGYTLQAARGAPAHAGPRRHRPLPARRRCVRAPSSGAACGR